MELDQLERAEAHLTTVDEALQALEGRDLERAQALIARVAPSEPGAPAVVGG